MAPSKPHPAMLLQALEATGVEPANAVFVGDTTYDMEMAQAAEVRSMGVSWGYHGAERLSAHGIWVCAVPLTQQRLLCDLQSCSQAQTDRHPYDWQDHPMSG